MDSATERPWGRSYATGVPLDIEVPDGSLVDLLLASVDRFGPKVALDFFGATTRYGALGEQVARAAEALRLLGVRYGDRVALVLPNCPQHVVAFYAVLRLGAVVVEHNPLYTEDELAFQLGDHRPRVVDRLGQGRPAGRAGRRPRRRRDRPGRRPVECAPREAAPAVEASPGEGA